MLRTVRFYGALEALAGTPSLELDVDTPVMLFQGLRSQIKGFRKWCDEHKLAVVLTSKDREPESLSMDGFTMSLGSATDGHLVPETEGAGVEFAAVATFLEAYGITSTLAAVVAYVAVNVAISYAIGAVAQALAGSPDTSSGTGRPEERPSFLYSGPVNTTAQGHAVPIVYGVHMVGSTVISAGITVEDIPYTTAQAEPPANGGGTAQPDTPPTYDWQWNDTLGGA